MKQEDYLLFMGWVYALMTIGGLALFAFKGSEIDTFGHVFGVCFLALFTYKSYTCFKDLKVVREEDMVYAPPSDPTLDEQISYFKRVLMISVIGFPLFSVWTCFDLNRVESGEVDSVTIWGPVAFLYDIGGYWVAVFAVPILGLFVIGTMIKKISDLKKQ